MRSRRSGGRARIECEQANTGSRVKVEYKWPSPCVRCGGKNLISVVFYRRFSSVDQENSL